MALAVLDASAFFAVLKGEPGADRVKAVMHDCIMSSVNAAEVYSKFAEWGVPAAARELAFATIPAIIVDFDVQLARAAGDLRAVTKRLALSLGDRACLALAQREGLPALTSDQAWAKANLTANVQLIK